MIDIKNRNIILLLVVFFLGALGFYVNDPFGLFEFSYKKAPPLLAGFDENKVEQITVKENGEVARVFVRNGSQWAVREKNTTTAFKANAKNLEKGFENLKKMKKYRVISSSLPKQAEYEVLPCAKKGEVKPKEGQTITCDDFILEIRKQGESKPIQVFLGKAGGSFNSTLVRLQEANDIYAVAGSMRNDWNQTLEYYRDKKLFNFVKENIKGVDIEGPFRYNLTKNDLGNWNITEKGKSKPAIKQRMESMLQQLASVEGTKFFKEKKAPRRYARVKVYLLNNTTAELNIFGPNKQSEFVITSTVVADAMLIPKYRIDTILLDPKTIEDNSAQKPQQPGLPGVPKPQ